jgi:hypothetical protein
MNEKEKAILKTILRINSTIISNLNDENIIKFKLIYDKLEEDVEKIIKKPNQEKKHLIWMNFPNMTEEEIKQEFNNVEQYPDLEAIKSAVKGYLDMQKVSKVKTRETLIKHIIETYKRGSFISKLGENKLNVPKG